MGPVSHAPEKKNSLLLCIIIGVWLLHGRHKVLQDFTDQALSKGHCVASSFLTNEREMYSFDEIKIFTIYEYEYSIFECANVSVDAGSCFVQQGAPRTLQCLPTFVIVGTMKGGTGAMMRYLNLHPALMSGKRILPYGKLKNEVHYFDQCGSDKSCHWIRYINFFPTQNLEDFPHLKMTFEKTPSYIASKIYLESMHQMLPSLRIIVLLRNPVDRAISAFIHHCRHQRYVSFHEHGRLYLANSIYLNQSYQSQYAMRPVQTPCKAADLFLYYDRRNPHCLNELSLGHYYDQMQNLFNVFDVDRILVLFQEQMAKNAKKTIEEVENWLFIPHLIQIPPCSECTHDSGLINTARNVYIENVYKALQRLKNHIFDVIYPGNCSHRLCKYKTRSNFSGTTRKVDILGSKELEKMVLRLDHHFRLQNRNLQLLLQSWYYPKVHAQNNELGESPDTTSLLSKYDHLYKSLSEIEEETVMGNSFWW